MRRIAAVASMIVAVGVIVAAYASHVVDGFDRRTAFLGAGLLVLVVWLARLVFGVWRARRFEQTAALLTFAGTAVGGAWAAVDVIRRIRIDAVPIGAPRIHLMAPAVITIAAAAVVVLVGGTPRTDR